MGIGLILRLVLGGFFSAVKSVLGFCLEHWKIVLPLLIAAALAFYVWRLNVHIEKDQVQIKKGEATIAEQVITIAQWNKKYDELRAEYDNSLQVCKASIEAQNAKVMALAKQADKFKEQSSAAVKAIDGIKKRYEEELQAAMNAPKPKTCNDTLKYLIEYAKETKGWEQPK